MQRMHGARMKPQTRPILPIATCIRVCMGMHGWLYAHAIHVWALIRIWTKQGFPAILVWAARTRTGSPYVYGSRKLAHTRMGSPYAYGQNTRMGQNNSTWHVGIGYCHMDFGFRNCHLARPPGPPVSNYI